MEEIKNILDKRLENLESRLAPNHVRSLLKGYYWTKHTLALDNENNELAEKYFKKWQDCFI